MRQPTLTIFYQFNPWKPSIGGIQTCIRYVLKFAPQTLQLRLVGTGCDPSEMPDGSTSIDRLTPDCRPLGQWYETELYGRTFQFMPLIRLKNQNVRKLIPDTIRYTLALQGRDFSSDFLQFHRLEPTLMARRWSGTKIFYIHNDIGQAVKGASREGGILWRRVPWAYFALERQLVGQFDRVLSCNTKSAHAYQQRYPDIADRVAYLPNTVDSDLFYPLAAIERQQGRQQLAHELGLPAATRFILFAGRLHPQKQPLLLIRSFAALGQSDTHLLIVGQGELEADIRAEIDRLGLTQRVTVLAPLSQAKLADLYRVASIFVLTSAYEGLCRGSIEALACGTPVVTTRAGETPNFLTAASGIVCDDQTPRSIAAAWQQVLQHPEQYPAEACVEVVQPYDARHVVYQTYRELLEQWQQQQTRSIALPATQFQSLNLQ